MESKKGYSKYTDMIQYIRDKECVSQSSIMKELNCSHSFVKMAIDFFEQEKLIEVITNNKTTLIKPKKMGVAS